MVVVDDAELASFARSSEEDDEEDEDFDDDDDLDGMVPTKHVLCQLRAPKKTLSRHYLSLEKIQEKHEHKYSSPNEDSILICLPYS